MIDVQTDSKLLFAASALVASWLLWVFFVPPKQLHNGFNKVPIIKNRLPGLGGVGFYANRYTL